MKRSTMKLELLTIITVIALATLSSTPASALDPPRYIHGSYAASSSQTFLVAALGFEGTTPINVSSNAWALANLAISGEYTFNANGSGSASGTGVSINALNPGNTAALPGYGQMTWSFTFLYTITPSTGAITLSVKDESWQFTWTAGAYASTPTVLCTFITPSVSFSGTISPDGHTILLNSATPTILSYTPDVVPGITPQVVIVGSTIMVMM